MENLISELLLCISRFNELNFLINIFIDERLYIFIDLNMFLLLELKKNKNRDLLFFL